MDFLDLNTCSQTPNCRCPWWTQAKFGCNAGFVHMPYGSNIHMHSSAAGKLREGGLLQLDTIQDFLCKLGMKPLKHLVEIVLSSDLPKSLIKVGLLV